MKNTPCASQETLAITFPADCCVFGRFGALLPGLNHCFYPLRDSGVSWWICFLNRHKSTQKLFRIAIKIGKILLRSGDTNAFWSIVSNRGTHLAQIFLIHKCVCKILTTTLSWDGYDLSYLTHFHFRVVSFGRAGLGMVPVSVQPQQNSVNHFWTISYDEEESE